MSVFTRPTEPNKPTAWIKALDLKYGEEETLAMLWKNVEEQNAVSGNHVPFKTENVKKPHIKRFKKWLAPLTDKSPQKLATLPVGGICLCHHNADEAVERLTFAKQMMGCPFTFRRAVGYNLMTCGCGRDLHAEVHSVIYCEENGEYYDITEDMYYEKYKWFVECPILTENYERIASRKHGMGNRAYDMLSNEREGCKNCDIRRLQQTYANANLDGVFEAFNHHR